MIHKFGIFYVIKQNLQRANIIIIIYIYNVTEHTISAMIEIAMMDGVDIPAPLDPRKNGYSIS